MRYSCFFIISLLVMFSCGGRGGSGARSAAKPAPEKAGDGNSPVYYTYKVVESYPHNGDSYTQGLFWYDGKLYEGTGGYGESKLMRVDPATGGSLQSVALDDKYFGEGIAVLRDTLYQLTWQSGVAVTYDAGTLRKTGELKYPGEGWGLTTDGEHLYMSDGSHRIYKMPGGKISKGSYIEVTLDGKRVHYLNELEWIDGQIWANVYMSDVVVRIDPADGRVVGVIDLSGILPEKEHTYKTDVLNGIAYDTAAKRLLVTGKNWTRLFHIELVGTE